MCHQCGFGGGLMSSCLHGKLALYWLSCPWSIVSFWPFPLHSFLVSVKSVCHPVLNHKSLLVILLKLSMKQVSSRSETPSFMSNTPSTPWMMQRKQTGCHRLTWVHPIKSRCGNLAQEARLWSMFGKQQFNWCLLSSRFMLNFLNLLGTEPMGEISDKVMHPFISEENFYKHVLTCSCLRSNVF